jgi:AcrR family transcriptional regulator
MCEELKNILTKVRCLYQKYGIKSVTMDDVAHELGISKKTLYHYVKDKNDLVEHVVNLELEEGPMSSKNADWDQLNAIEEMLEVHKMVDRMIKTHNPSTEYDLKKYYPEEYQKVQKVRRERIYNFMLNNIRKGKNEGLYRPEINEEYITKMHVSRVEHAFDNNIFTSDEMSSSALFYEVFIYHIRGVASEKGIEFLEKKLKETENNHIK